MSTTTGLVRGERKLSSLDKEVSPQMYDTSSSKYANLSTKSTSENLNLKHHPPTMQTYHSQLSKYFALAFGLKKDHRAHPLLQPYFFSLSHKSHK